MFDTLTRTCTCQVSLDRHVLAQTPGPDRTLFLQIFSRPLVGSGSRHSCRDQLGRPWKEGQRGYSQRMCATWSVGYWWWCAGGKVTGEGGQLVGEEVFLGKVKGIREWLTDGVEQLSGQSLLSSVVLTSMSPDYTTLLGLGPYCFYFIVDKLQHVCLPASCPPPLLEKFKRH